MPPSIPIVRIRGLAVILDADLAVLYGTTTGALNQAANRNQERFPDEFRFQLAQAEWDALKSQIVISKPGRGGRRRLPWAFTEHGALMASNVLNTPEAVKMSVFIVRAFIKQRELLATNESILRRLAEIDKKLLLHDSTLRDLYHQIFPLLQPPPDPPKRKIGFQP
jgi:hypothetical protein